MNEAWLRGTTVPSQEWSIELVLYSSPGVLGDLMRSNTSVYNLFGSPMTVRDKQSLTALRLTKVYSFYRIISTYSCMKIVSYYISFIQGVNSIPRLRSEHRGPNPIADRWD
jgi:hypothetical protein